MNVIFLCQITKKGQKYINKCSGYVAWSYCSQPAGGWVAARSLSLPPSATTARVTAAYDALTT